MARSYHEKYARFHLRVPGIVEDEVTPTLPPRACNCLGLSLWGRGGNWPCTLVFHGSIKSTDRHTNTTLLPVLLGRVPQYGQGDETLLDHEHLKPCKYEFIRWAKMSIH